MLTEISEPATLHKFAFVRLYGENAKCFCFLFALAAGRIQHTMAQKEEEKQLQGPENNNNKHKNKNRSTTIQSSEKFSSSLFQIVHR